MPGGGGQKEERATAYLKIISLCGLEGMFYRGIVFVLVAYLAVIEVGEEKVLVSEGIYFFRYSCCFAFLFLSFLHSVGVPCVGVSLSEGTVLNYYLALSALFLTNF